MVERRMMPEIGTSRPFFDLGRGLTAIAASNATSMRQVRLPLQVIYTLNLLGAAGDAKHILWASDCRYGPELTPVAARTLGRDDILLGLMCDWTDDPLFGFWAEYDYQGGSYDDVTFFEALAEGARLRPDFLVIEAVECWMPLGEPTPDQKSAPAVALRSLPDDLGVPVVVLRSLGRDASGGRIDGPYPSAGALDGPQGIADTVIELHQHKDRVAAVCTRGPQKGQMRHYKLTANDLLVQEP